LAIGDWRLAIGDYRQLHPIRALRILRRFQRFCQNSEQNLAAPRLRLPWAMNPKTEALRARTHEFFVRVIAFCETLSGSPAAHNICRQLLESAGGTDSNYRAACRARSQREFIAKIGIAVEEADESLGWLQAPRCKAGRQEHSRSVDQRSE
jgi:four helix bundle protein